nr:prolipoprotein diacylglyceryl transferase [uncultured bacterium]
MRYWFLLALGWALSFVLYGRRLKNRELPWKAALPAGLAGLILGPALAKVSYVLLLWPRQIGRYGIQALIMLDNPAEYCVFGGIAGLCIAAAVMARVGCLPVARCMDAFAPCAALMLGFIRLGEYELDTLGLGGYLTEEHPLARPPFAVQNSWEEWFWAVFLLEAAVALAVALIFALRRDRVPGLTLELTLFFLALAQILMESFRARCMKWGFVRVEQVLCAVLAVALICRACWKLRLLWPVEGAVLSVLIVVWAELGLDKWSSFPDWTVYLIMAFALVRMGVIEGILARRRSKAARAAV